MKNKLQLKSVGSGDAFASKGLFQSCHLLKYNDLTIMLDCGATTLNALDHYDESTLDIDYIFISHFHGDHITGVPFLLLKSFYAHNRTKKLNIVGVKGLKEKLSHLMNVTYPGKPEKILDEDFLNVVEVEPFKTYETVEFSFQFYPVEHSEQVLPHGVKLMFNDNKVFTYTGDTNLCETIQEVIKEVDFMLTECSFNELDVVGHMNVDNILTLQNQNPHCRLFLCHSSEKIHLMNKSITLLEQGRSYTLK